MFSIRYRSAVFKLLLAGILAVLVASYSADAAPTGKPAKAALGRTAPKPVGKAPLKGPTRGAGKAPSGKTPPLAQTPGGKNPGNKGTPSKGTGAAQQVRDFSVVSCHRKPMLFCFL